MILQRELTLEDYLAIVRRRIWFIVLPAIVFSIGAYSLSRLLKNRFTSQTVVLVEQPSVPETLVKPVIGGDVNQRLATMQEQILSRTRLQQIIEKFGLYKEDIAKGASMEDLVARFRQSITVSPVRPMAETRASGLPGFTVSVVANEAFTAEQICTEITSFFMQQNLLLRERRAEDTLQFLTKQLSESKRKLDEQDAKLAEFQRKYMGELPEELPANLNVLSGLSSQLDAISQALNRAQQDKLFVQSLLEQEKVNRKNNVVQGPANDPDNLNKQLVQLQDRLAFLRSQYTEQHPDVRRAKKDIADLEKRIADSATPQPAATQVATAPGDNLPEVETAQTKQLKQQLHQLDQTIRDKAAQQAKVQQEIDKVQSKLSITPSVGQEYKALTRDYQTALGIYNDLLKKQNDSEIATDLERRQQGEQFRVLDPPSLPQKPTFPNRPLFAVGGFFGGIAFGVALAALLEFRDTTFHTERDVERALKFPVLATIPILEPPKSHSGDSPLSSEHFSGSAAARVAS
jgi:polysaccharide chain length determinant protein (PEP-CTERM system associated)